MKGDVCINFEGSEEDCPKPAPGFKFDARGVLVADGSTPRSDSQRWRLVKEFHPLLRLEHWDGHGWGSLYGEAADKIVDELILKAKP